MPSHIKSVADKHTFMIRIDKELKIMLLPAEVTFVSLSSHVNRFSLELSRVIQS